MDNEAELEKQRRSTIWVQKVKVSNNRVRIEYVKGEDVEDGDEYMINSREAAAPELYKDFTDLQDDVIRICELPESYKLGLSVISVSFSYTKGVMGATITALKALAYSQAPLVLNTPHKPSEPYEEDGDDTYCLPIDAVISLRLLIAHAIEYIDGKRAQLELEEAEKEPELELV